MAKVDRNAWRKDGYFSGYADYRYGQPKKPPSPHPIYAAKKRKHVIGKIMNVLADWRASPFEFEATCRHGLRASLCLAGYEWRSAEAEAVAIVSEALRRLGAQRPRWDQGQPEYTTPRENCAWCAGPMPEESFLGNRKFRYCSFVCANSAKERRNFEERTHRNKAYGAVARMVARSVTKERVCDECGGGFHPVSNASTQRFCSMRCRGKSQRTRPATQCRHCGAATKHPHIFCSVDCYSAYGATKRWRKSCKFCGCPFEAKVAHASYCSITCRRHAERFAKVVYLTPAVFDVLMKRAA